MSFSISTTVLCFVGDSSSNFFRIVRWSFSFPQKPTLLCVDSSPQLFCCLFTVFISPPSTLERATDTNHNLLFKGAYKSFHLGSLDDSLRLDWSHCPRHLDPRLHLLCLRRPHLLCHLPRELESCQKAHQ